MRTLAKNVLNRKRVTQLLITSCSKSTVETPEKCMNLIRVNNIISDVVLVSLLVTFNFVPSGSNLVLIESFRNKRKVKKKPWNSSNTWLKFAQIEGIFFSKKIRNTWTAILKTLKTLVLVLWTFSMWGRGLKQNINKWAESDISISLYVQAFTVN